METKNKYSVTLKDGTVLTRQSHHNYLAAWAVWFDGKLRNKGFSSTETGAKSSMQSCVNQLTGNVKYRNAWARRHMTRKENEISQAMKKVDTQIVMI